MNNNNKQLFTRMYGVAIALILSVLSLAVQAQYSAEPTDFDRLLSGEFNAVSPPVVTNSNCDAGGDTNTFDCSGVLYLRFSPTINIGEGDAGGNQLVVRMEARAGQEPIGTPLTPASCINPNTDEELVLISFGSPVPITNAGQCDGAGQQAGLASGEAEFTSEKAGTIDADNPANLLYNVEAQFTYSKGIFVGNPENPSFANVCTGATAYTSAQATAPAFTASAIDTGVGSYAYGSANQDAEPGTLTPAQAIQYPTDDYAEIVTITCNLPATASAQLLGMSYHLSAYGNAAFGHHVGVSAGDSYVTSPENSLEFFPLDGSNYIEHAEITEDGLGVLIEYAQAVTDNTSQSYTMTTGDGLTDVTPAISDTIWLNDKTVWLALSSDIYDNAGVNTHATVALGTDRHVLVSSTFPSDTDTTTGFGTNFGQASTYRAVLTRHMSDSDLARATTISDITVNPGTESIDLTFSSPVCGSPETGCAALTADHFEVIHYGGVETEAPTSLPISFVDLTGDATDGYTAVALNINLPPLLNIDSNDYVLVRTAKNSRFSDEFITDRTIFSQSSAQTGMLHLQGGALVQAIPTIAYSLAPAPGIPPSPDIETDGPDAYSIREGGATDNTTATFTITRSPTGYDMPSATSVTITNTTGGNPAGFELWVAGEHFRVDDFIAFERMITFAAGEDEKTISFTFAGNDTPNDPLNDAHVYTIRIAPANVPPGDDEETITFTIEDDDRGIDLLAIDDSVILETAVEKEAGSEQQFVRIYPDATPLDNIIEEVGGRPDEFRITQIVLTVTGIGADTAVVIHNNSFDEDNNGNEFTFDSRDSDGVAISDAETFLESLEFGIDSPEPTGPVTLELTITNNETGLEETVMADRTITEENDPVELVGRLEDRVVTVLADDLFNGSSSGSLLVILPEEGENITVNDGGDDSGISVEINPDTLDIEAADGSGMRTLTLSDDVTPEGAFTLSISRSDVELAPTALMITLTFSDGRNPTPSSETRAITINIVSDDIPPTPPDNTVITLVNINEKQPFTLLDATQVILEFDSAYDRVGSMADLDKAPFTRNVDYVITIMRMEGEDKIMRKLLLMRMSASDLGVPSVDDPNSTPTSVSIKLTLDRNDVTLIPGDSYMVDISVTDRAGNPNTADNPDTAITYDMQMFTMSTEGAYEELVNLVDCGTDPDSDNDGIASVYELHIGTDCTDVEEYDYIGSADPMVSAEITLPSEDNSDVLVVAAGASIYTPVDTEVTCKPTGEEKIGCDNLKAFIVSSGLGGSADADAVSMVTEICPDDPDDVSSIPSSCWIDDAFVDGNVRTIPLPLGYNLINWVAADRYGNLPRNNARPPQVIKKHSLYM